MYFSSSLRCVAVNAALFINGIFVPHIGDWQYGSISNKPYFLAFAVFDVNWTGDWFRGFLLHLLFEFAFGRRFD